MTYHEQAVDAILERDNLRVTPEERERLLTIYAEMQSELEAMRIADVRYGEPAIAFRATPTESILSS